MDLITSGGILGNLVRGVGQKLGLGKRYNEPTYDMSRLSSLPLGGSAAFENLDIRKKFNRNVDEVKPVQTFEFDSSKMQSPLLQGAESATGLTIAELQALIDNATNNLGSS